MDKILVVIISLIVANLISASGTKELTIDEIVESYKADSSLWIKPHLSEGVEFREIEALPQTPPYPTHNPYSKEKAELGENLFNDPKLSASNQIACANCHDEQLGFSDGRSVSYGHDRQKGRRNSPSITMSAFGVEKFWDGRAKNLEAQAIMPIADPKEMAYDATKAAKKLNKIQSYKEAFKGAFGTSEITKELIGKAIATYERGTMRHTKFDRFMRGNKNAMNEKEIYGMHLFRTKARCINCHNGVEFSDNKYHNLGLHFYGREKYEDLGRYEVSKNIADVGAFKTPSLRGVSKSAPYMHNGLFPHLSGVIHAYNAGMANPTPKNDKIYNPPFPQTSHLLQKLNLSKDEMEALEAFLRAL